MKSTHFSSFSKKKVNFYKKWEKIKKKHGFSVFFFSSKNDQYKKLPKITSRLRRNILKTVLDRYGCLLSGKATLNATLSTCSKVSHLKSTKSRFLGEICDLFDF